MKKPVLVIGHRHPDTDSICAALAYAYLKRHLGMAAVAGRAGKLNKETKFVLDYFKVEPPQLVNDLYPQLDDITLKQPPVLHLHSTLIEIGQMFADDKNLKYLVVLGAGKEVLGIITTSDLARMYYLDMFKGALTDPYTPAKDFMSSPVVTLSSTDLLTDVRDKMAAAEYVGYPVVEHGHYMGMIDRGMMLIPKRPQVILVDHNERSQAVEGIEEADIVEIIDHHRLGGLTTGNPIFIRQEPVGSTCTIVANLAWHRGVELTPALAGILFSAIISDTLYFHSPTVTDFDRTTAERLAREAGIEDTKTLALAILQHGADITGLSAQEILSQDVKEFTFGSTKVSISQFSVLDDTQVLRRQAELDAALEEWKEKENCDLSLLMLTNILQDKTLLLTSEGFKGPLSRAFGQSRNGVYDLQNVLSRKKQVVPPLAEALRD
ncbi:MAG: DHH family phosphoesterase [Acidaminococcaceae bacterium]|nr:DHH family phosphoesterase [Acidaminococcaceae bacterium]